jgi:multisubunit Na+/H+ antiporter MnhF subunit
MGSLNCKTRIFAFDVDTHMLLLVAILFKLKTDNCTYTDIKMQAFLNITDFAFFKLANVQKIE